MIVLPQFVGEDFENHFKEFQSHEEYHGDKTAINSSALKLFEQSPAAVYSHYLVHDAEDPTEPEHFRLGRALHAAALEPKRFLDHVVQEPEFRGTGSRAERKEWLAAQPKDAIILKPKLFLQVEGMVNSILGNSDAVNLLKHGTPEISGYFRDQATGIKAKVRPDLWNDELGILLDVKTCLDASSKVFSRKIFEYKYHLSMAMYSEGLYQISGSRPSTCILLAIEKKPPYECAVLICKDEMLRAGLDEYNYAMAKLKTCLETNIWPQRQVGMEEIDLPEWAYPKKEIENYE